jgi:hypothetical protein
MLPVALLGLLAAALSMPSPASGCGESVLVRDYLGKVKRAAPIREVPPLRDPTSKQLPFAPPGLRLRAIGSGLIVGRSKVGFSLSSPLKNQRDLGWIVESELFEVNAQGKIVQSQGVKQRRVGSTQGYAAFNLLHRVSAAPAYYRADIQIFRKGTDRILGQYSFYTRVMKPRIDLRLKIDRYTVAPEEFAEAALLNMGTVSLLTRSYDYKFKVQEFSGERWIDVPPRPPRFNFWLRRPWALPAGFENRGCLRYLVGTYQSSAIFRFVLFGQITKTTMLTAEFQVASPQSIEY